MTLDAFKFAADVFELLQLTHFYRREKANK